MKYALQVYEVGTPLTRQAVHAGWADEVEELTVGEAGVAAPIRGYGGLLVGSIGVSGAVERVCNSKGRPNPALVAHVRDAARAVSRDLGASRW